VYGNKLRKKISWPDLIICSASLHWLWPCNTNQISRDLEIIKPQHVKQIYTLLGKEIPVRKLYPSHSLFLTEELLKESLCHPQKICIHPRHTTVFLFSVSHPWEKKPACYKPHAPTSRWHCSTTRLHKRCWDGFICAKVYWSRIEESRLLLGKNYNKIVGWLLNFVWACYWVL